MVLLRLSRVAACAATLSACSLPALRYDFSNNPGLATSHGAMVTGESCVTRVGPYNLGVAIPTDAIKTAVDKANQRDHLTGDQAYNALVEADLREVQGSFKYCWEVAGFPARVTLGTSAAGSAAPAPAPAAAGTSPAATEVKK